MATTTPFIEQLRKLPGSERRARIEELARTEFRAALLMTDDEDIPLDQNYFDLGLTSLRVTETKQRLEERLGCVIDTALLFSAPTLGRLVEHLHTEVLPALLGEGTAPGGPASAVPGTRKKLVDDLLADLYKA
ncbi:acyl carrier protein [Streptomyces sp. DT24]|uniref:acyl carrier protein n=1 Tax=unclassified Streptomyces TaxID=2593676 RepID=UPI0023B902A8|nr:acyl carrier protein [Streptomyces sp. AM 4-1-1]WEH36339.1 acyl carrier protein [Streptomyces sp. AM 4-1-1]